ncbi:Tim44 domain-containing protein [Desulfovibrio psychrotolerans]|nr:Tim44-like domain-containing protein [Desulfovibrio psychrotolerans]
MRAQKDMQSITSPFRTGSGRCPLCLVAAGIIVLCLASAQAFAYDVRSGHVGTEAGAHSAAESAGTPASMASMDGRSDSEGGTAPRRGLVDGLLSGTLIGSLLTGSPFTGVGVADILLIVLLFVLGRRFLRIRTLPRDNEQPRAKGRPDNVTPFPRQSEDSPRDRHTPVSPDIPEDEPNPHLHARAADMWAHLKGNDEQGRTQQAPRKRSEGMLDAPPAQKEDRPLTARDAYRSPSEANLPPDFDAADFLKGAKMVFARLQHSWDARDMDDIAQFTTPEVHEEIRIQAEQDPAPSSSELLLVNARLMEVKQDENGLLATVFFDVLMRENVDGASTEQVREIWHFLKSAEYDGMWRLDGIEQVSS